MTLQHFLLFIGFYLLIGVVFAIGFVMWGVTVIDEAAKESGWRFRIIIIPGAIIFWPLLLGKWMSVSKNEKLND